MGSIHLFRNLPDVKRYAAGEYIFRKGERGSTMYMIIEGDIDIVVGRSVVDVAHPGSFIGEMAMIDASLRSASARARTDARVFPIGVERFRELISGTPVFVLDVMKALTLRLRRTGEKMSARRPAPALRPAARRAPAKRKARRAR